MIIGYCKKLVFLLFILAFVNCGGGDDAGPAEYSLASFKNLDPGFTLEFSLTGSTSEGVDITLLIKQTNEPLFDFEGKTVTPVKFEFTLTNHTTQMTDIYVGYEYYEAGFKLAGILKTNGFICRPVLYNEPPDKVRVGDSAVFAKYECDDTLSQITEWRVDEAAGGRASFVVKNVEKNAIGEIIYTAVDSYTIDTAGNIYTVKSEVDYVSDGFTMSLSGNKTN